MRVATITAVLALAFVVCGCNPSGDPSGWSVFRVRSASDSPVILQFGGTSDDPDIYNFLVPARTDGTVHLLQGPSWTGRVAVLNESCKVVWERRVEDEQGGSLLIDHRLAVEWASGFEAILGPSESQVPPLLTDTHECSHS